MKFILMMSLIFSVPAVSQDIEETNTEEPVLINVTAPDVIEEFVEKNNIVTGAELNHFCPSFSEDDFDECTREYEICTTTYTVQNQQEGVCHKAFMMCTEVRKFFICMENLEKVNQVVSSLPFILIE